MEYQEIVDRIFKIIYENLYEISEYNKSLTNFELNSYFDNLWRCGQINYVPLWSLEVIGNTVKFIPVSQSDWQGMFKPKSIEFEVTIKEYK